jgi:hypothetical protein
LIFKSSSDTIVVCNVISPWQWAKDNGMTDEEVKLLGRWKYEAFRLYYQLSNPAPAEGVWFGRAQALQALR